MKLYTAFILSFLFTGCILSTQGRVPARFSEKVRATLQCISGKWNLYGALLLPSFCEDALNSGENQYYVKQELAYCDDSIFKNVNKRDCEKLASLCSVQYDKTVLCRFAEQAKVAADKQIKDWLKKELEYCKETSTSYTKATSYIKAKCAKLNSICSH